MAGVDSVETIVVTRARDASKVVDSVRAAEVVFFAGGDQCTYTTLFGGVVRDAVASVVARGGGVGGTSAGMAIQAPTVYDGCVGSAVSAVVLADPYDRSVTFSYDHFHWPVLAGVVTDTHFVARDRMGRLMVFLSRQLADGRTNLAIGVAADEASSVFIGRNGVATVMGIADSYVVIADGKPEVCLRNKPLTYRGFKVWRLSPGDTFDLSDWPTDGYTVVDVVDGVLSADPYR
jgi:cyanophycinase-like exopeptidase